MNLFEAILLGAVEGITEFLPISSTGHLILVSYFTNIPESATLFTFQIAVQLGAIASIIFLYRNKFLQKETLLRIIAGFIPTGIIGLLVYPYIKYLLQSPLLVAITLTVGGIIILAVEKWYKGKLSNNEVKRVDNITYRQAFLLGIYQALAIIPGVSRSGAMIIGGLTMKLPRAILAEFTFLVAVPTITIATVFTIYKNFNDLTLSSISPIVTGMLVSFIIALFVIKFFLKYIKNHSFAIFGWYRIFLGIILFFILI